MDLINEFWSIWLDKSTKVDQYSHMNVLMTGATGFVGRPLVQRLLREGHRVRAQVRDPARARALLGSQVELVGVNETDACLARVLEDSEAVINLAGEGVLDHRWSKARRGALYNSRIDTTRRLVTLLEDLPTRPRLLISASAVGYYGPSPEGGLTESDPQGPGFLARLCGDWEHTASAASSLGLRVVQLRTGIVLGNGGGALARLVPLFRAGLGGRLGNGQQAMPWIHVHDVIEIIMASLANVAIEGPINVVSPHPVSNSEFTRELACALGKRSFLPVPGFALKLALGKAATVLLGGQRAVPAALLSSVFEFQYPELGPALHNLLSGDETLRIGRAEQHAATSPYLQARGARYELCQETVIDAPLDEVFAFFSNAENLGLLTPTNLGFIIKSPLPIEMRRGTHIDYTIRVHGLPMRWQTEIESWQPGVSFVDSQIRGPYRCWWHEHSFRALGSQTIMQDRVLYSPPLGPLGWLAHRLKIRAMLTEIFRYRSKAIELQFAKSSGSRGDSPSWPKVA